MYAIRNEICYPIRPWMKFSMCYTFVVDGVSKMNLTKEQWDNLK